MRGCFRTLSRLAAPVLFLTAVLLTLSGCGGSGGSSSDSSNTASETPAALNVFVTDAFSDQYQQVLVTLYKIELTTDSTDYQTVYSDTAGQTINLSSLASTQELLASLDVPAGTYTKARITFGDHFTLVTQAGVSTSVVVASNVGADTNGEVALIIATPNKLVAGSPCSLVVDFKLAEFQLVGGALQPTVTAGDGSGEGNKDCFGHLIGTVVNLVAGTSFNLEGPGGRTIKVALTSTTTVVSGQTGKAVTLADGQNVQVDGAFNPTTQTVTATSVTLNDYTTTQHERAEGTVASINATADSFVLTVQNAEGIQPTGGTITVQTGSNTFFMKPKMQTGTLADVTTGATVGADGSSDSTTQTLTARGPPALSASTRELGPGRTIASSLLAQDTSPGLRYCTIAAVFCGGLSHNATFSWLMCLID